MKLYFDLEFLFDLVEDTWPLFSFWEVFGIYMSGFGACTVRYVQRAIFSNEQCKLKYHLMYAYKNFRVKKSSPWLFLCN